METFSVGRCARTVSAAWRWPISVATLLTLSAVTPQAAQPAAVEAAAAATTAVARGRLIRVPLPITDTVTRTVRNMVQGAVQQFRDQNALGGTTRPILILQLDPGASQFGAGSDFGEALSLAELLSSPKLAGVKTVAYIPHSVKGHTVLVAIACEEIVMAPDAEIGQAGVDLPGSAPITPVVRAGYRQIAGLRRTIPVPVALGMLDKELQVSKVETEVSLEFVLEEDLDELHQRLAIQSEEILIQRGELGWFSGRQARELGFAKYLAGDRDALARALNLPPEALQEDPLLGRRVDPRQLAVAGPITVQLAGRVQSMIDDELRSGTVNFVCVRIDSPGGSLAGSLNLANSLIRIKRSAVRTVAYVANQARADAALIALACDHLVMHPQAILGGPTPGEEPPQRDDIEAARAAIRESLTAGQSGSWSLVAATIDPALKVYRYRHRTTGATRYFSRAEAEAQADANQWQQGEQVTKDGQPLEVNGVQAKELGLAWDVVESFDELKRLYGLEGDPRLVEPSWADFLIDALASPGVATLLLILGGAALYAELHAPGIGIGGFVAGVAFLLFFWSKYLDGTSTWLEVMLFLGGMCFLLLEVFVIPGFGVFGLGGGLMIILSLVLASQTFVIPRSNAQFAELRSSTLVVAAAALGIIAAAALIRRYAPRTPVLNRLLLPPMEDRQVAALARRETMVDYQHLQGARGVTTTQLTPSGKARFGAELIDVMADGEVIDRGRQVVVVSVHGNRIAVREVVAEG